jgi:hypothetical protein
LPANRFKPKANSDWFITHAIKSIKITSALKLPQNNKRSEDHEIPTPTIDFEPKKGAIAHLDLNSL